MFRGHIPDVVNALVSDTFTGLTQPRSHWSAWTSRAASMRLGRRCGRTEHMSKVQAYRRRIADKGMLLDERRGVSMRHGRSSFNSPRVGERKGGWSNGDGGITVTFWPGGWTRLCRRGRMVAPSLFRTRRGGSAKRRAFIARGTTVLYERRQRLNVMEVGEEQRWVVGIDQLFGGGQAKHKMK